VFETIDRLGLLDKRRMFEPVRNITSAEFEDFKLSEPGTNGHARRKDINPSIIMTESMQSNNDVENHVIYTDVLRILAIISVVILHASGNLGMTEPVGSLNWWAGVSVYCSMMFGVPVFFMISGSLLLNQSKWNEDLRTFFKKRIIRVGIPFITWILLLYFWEVYFSNKSFDASTLATYLVTRPTNPYWFFYSIAGLYLATPVIRVFIKHAPEKLIRYYIYVWLFFYCFTFAISYYTEVLIGIDNTIFYSYIGYFLLGYYLGNYEIEKKLPSSCFMYIFLSALILSLILCYLININSSGVDWFIYQKQSPLQIIIQISIFLYVKAICDHADSFFHKHAETIRFFSAHVFGIFVVHLFVLQILLRGMLGFKINALWINVFIGITTLSVIVLVCSFLITYLLRKIPVIKHLIP